jgi:hypothetical protein
MIKFRESSDSDFTRLAARLRESGLTVYGFGERKTPKPFIAACDKFIYVENLTYDESTAAPAETTLAPKPTTSVGQLRGDTTLVNLLRNAVEAASDDDGWASLAAVGSITGDALPGNNPAPPSSNTAPTVGRCSPRWTARRSSGRTSSVSTSTRSSWLPDTARTCPT